MTPLSATEADDLEAACIKAGFHFAQLALLHRLMHSGWIGLDGSPQLVPALLHQLMLSGAEKETAAALKRAHDRMLTGGNHLANVLIKRLGAGFPERFPKTMPEQTAMGLLDNESYDIWCAWAACMRARDEVDAA